MDIALGRVVPRGHLKDALRTFFGNGRVAVSEDLEDLLEHPTPAVFVQSFTTQIPGFPFGLSLVRVPTPAAAFQIMSITLARFLNTRFSCETLCDGTGFGPTDTPYWSIVWRDGVAYLADDLPCDAEPPAPPDIRGPLSNLPFPPQTAPYSREEVERACAAGELPTRGEWCPACKNFIPSFEALSEEEATAIRTSRHTPGQAIESHRQFRAVTGSNSLWTKLWMMHLDGARHHPQDNPPASLEPSSLRLCPACSAPLGHGATRCWAPGCTFELPDRTYAGTDEEA